MAYVGFLDEIFQRTQEYSSLEGIPGFTDTILLPRHALFQKAHHTGFVDIFLGQEEVLQLGVD